jgi:hypothetical protein
VDAEDVHAALLRVDSRNSVSPEFTITSL